MQDTALATKVNTALVELKERIYTVRADSAQLIHEATKGAMMANLELAYEQLERAQTALSRKYDLV